MKSLFELPEYDRAFGRFVYVATDELMTAKSPILSQIQRVPASSIPATRNTMPDGTVVENEPMAVMMPFAVDFKDAVAGNLGAFTDMIDAAAESSLAELMPQFYGHIGRICEGAGTAIDARGEPFSHEFYLKMLQAIDIDFDENGKPELPTAVVSPAMAEAIQKLPPPTAEQQKRQDEIIESKRQEFNARQRHRQLS